MENIKLKKKKKKAYHDYFVEDTYEAGISLKGTEVKSLRMGKCNIKEAYIKDRNGEMFVYVKDTYDPTRPHYGGGSGWGEVGY